MIALLLAACTLVPSTPRASDLLGRPATATEAEVLHDATAFIAIEEAHVVVAYLPEGGGEPSVRRVPLAEHREAIERGRIKALEDSVTAARYGLDGPMPLLVDRSVEDKVLLAVLTSAAMANVGSFRTVLSGSAPALPDRIDGSKLVDSPPDPTERLAPGSPIRVAPGRYRIDERGARVRISLIDEGDQMATHDLLADLLRDAENAYLYPSFAEAEAQARYPVLPSVEMLLMVSKAAEEAAIFEAYDAVWEPAARRVVERGASMGEPASQGFFAVAGALRDGERPAAAEAFLSDPVRSRPLGPWGITADRQQAFQRDRWLAQSLPDALQGPLVTSLEDEALAADVSTLRAHQRRWTNPAAKPALEEGGAYLLPPSRSPESTFTASLSPEDAVGDAFVDAIQEGRVDLTPREDSGLHDRHVWALEPLLVPSEGDPEWSPGYRRRLEQAFQLAMAARRESQVKDLFLPTIGATMAARVAPELRIEPVPEHYDREAAVVEWLQADGQAASLDRVKQLYRNAAATSRVDLGLAEAEVEPWAWREEPALADDVRFMVPVAAVPEGVRVWAVLGVTPVDITVEYVVPPKVEPVDPGVTLDLKFVEQRATLLVPKLAELTVAEPLDREAFRVLANQHRWAVDLRHALTTREKP